MKEEVVAVWVEKTNKKKLTSRDRRERGNIKEWVDGESGSGGRCKR